MEPDGETNLMRDMKNRFVETVGFKVPQSLTEQVVECLKNGELIIIRRHGKSLSSKWDIEARNPDGTPKNDL